MAHDPVLSLAVAAGVGVVLSLGWLGPWARGPFDFLSTFFHELSHWVVGRLVGMRGRGIVITTARSGHCLLRHRPSLGRGRKAAVSAAGYLGQATIGGLTLVGNSWVGFARVWCIAVAAVCALSAAVLVRNGFGRLGLLGWAAVLGGMAWVWGDRPATVFAVDCVGVLVVLAGVHAVTDLVRLARRRHRRNDAAHLAATLGGPALLWGLVLAMIVAGVVAATIILRVGR